MAAASSDSSDCELPVSASEREEALCKQRREPPQRVSNRPPLQARDGAPLLCNRPSAPPEECYSEEELALSEYQRLHSVCSTEATASSTLQALSDLVGKQHVRAAELEKIPKTWDDTFLRRVAPIRHRSTELSSSRRAVAQATKQAGRRTPMRLWKPLPWTSRRQVRLCPPALAHVGAPDARGRNEQDATWRGHRVCFHVDRVLDS